jgi:hypothetical protein
MKLRNLVVSTAVAVGGAALAIKKLSANDELKEKVKVSGKKVIDSSKEFGKSVSEASKDVAKNIEVEANKAKEKFNDIKEEIKVKLDEKADQLDKESTETSASSSEENTPASDNGSDGSDGSDSDDSDSNNKDESESVDLADEETEKEEEDTSSVSDDSSSSEEKALELDRELEKEVESKLDSKNYIDAYDNMLSDLEKECKDTKSETAKTVETKTDDLEKLASTFQDRMRNEIYSAFYGSKNNCQMEMLKQYSMWYFRNAKRTDEVLDLEPGTSLKKDPAELLKLTLEYCPLKAFVQYVMGWNSTIDMENVEDLIQQYNGYNN